MDYAAVRDSIVTGSATVMVSTLHPESIGDIAWSGSPAHLENVALQLQRVSSGEVVYLVVRADGRAVSKGGIDFTKEQGAGTIWQLATHEQLEGLGLATQLIAKLEQHAVERGLRKLRLDVELDNPRAQRLYEHLGYRVTGRSDASWVTERPDGIRFLYSTTVEAMEKLV